MKMIMKVIGVELRKGEFTDPKTGKLINFNNIMVHALKPNKSENGDSFGFGKVPVSVKIKNDKDVVEAIFGSLVTKDDLISMVDCDYDITFDDKKQVDRITAAPAPAAKKGA